MICLFKANFSTPKGAGKFVRELPDNTGNECTHLDIHIGLSWAGHKNKWQIHAIWT